MKSQKGYTINELLIVLVVLFGATGWVMNIATIAVSNFNDITVLLVLRVIGVFVAPLGAVLGYF